MKDKLRKVYVDVVLRNDTLGNLYPLLIAWEDGRKFEVDRVKHVCRAASTKVGGCGIRYTIVVRGRETFLFHEDNKWFVEAKEYEL